MITSKQKERAMDIYRMMIEFQHETDFSMTTRDIAKNFGLKSNSNFTPHLKWLVDGGYVKVRGKQLRAIPQSDSY